MPFVIRVYHCLVGTIPLTRLLTFRLRGPTPSSWHWGHPSQYLKPPLTSKISFLGPLSLEKWRPFELLVTDYGVSAQNFLSSSIKIASKCWFCLSIINFPCFRALSRYRWYPILLRSFRSEETFAKDCTLFLELHPWKSMDSWAKMQNIVQKYFFLKSSAGWRNKTQPAEM